MALIGQASEMSVGNLASAIQTGAERGGASTVQGNPEDIRVRRYCLKHVLMVGLAGSRIDYGWQLLVCVI